MSKTKILERNVIMRDVEKVLSDKTAIANWEDEGGALKPVFLPQKRFKNKSILLWLGGLVGLSVLFWLTKRHFQK